MFIYTLTPFLLQLDGLGLVYRAKGMCKRPRKSVWESKDGHEVPEMEIWLDALLRAWDEYEGPEIGVKGFRWVWRS